MGLYCSLQKGNLAIIFFICSKTFEEFESLILFKRGTKWHLVVLLDIV